MLRRHGLLAVLLLPISITSIATPHPNAPELDILSDHVKRGRHSFQPKLLHPRLCDGVTDETCSQWDDEIKSNARNLQDIIKTNGFIRVLVLLIKFTDHVNKETPPIEEYDLLFNDPLLTDDVTPTGSVASWLNENSYGKFKMEAEIIPWHFTDNTEEYYSFDKYGISHDFRYSMYPVLDQLEAEGLDFSRFDLDQDGKIDSIVILHSGYMAEIGGVDCNTNSSLTNRIWSHGIAVNNDQWTSSDGSITANAYSVASAFRGTCGSRINRIGVITHEFLHTLGLPDLNDGSGEYIGRGLGDFDIMANAHGRNGAQVDPAFLSPWCKVQLNWTDPFEITKDGVYSIVASELQDNIYLIKSPYPDGEYLYIENRQPILWDRLLWTGGILIWHIDDNKDGETDRGYPGQEGWPGNQKHYEIAVEAADRLYDLETGENSGDEGDFWIQGMVYGPGPKVSEAKADSFALYPNSNSYKEGIIYQTGFSIRILTPTQSHMRFQVTGLTRDQPPTQSINPSPTRMPATSPTQKATDIPTTETTYLPIQEPSTQPSIVQSGEPSMEPTHEPSHEPSFHPSYHPSSQPTTKPITLETIRPTTNPTTNPTVEPTMEPTVEPTIEPTVEPTVEPSLEPTLEPTIEPTLEPSLEPIIEPTMEPTVIPMDKRTKPPVTQSPTLEPSASTSSLPSTSPTLPPVSPTGFLTTIPTSSPISTVLVPTAAPGRNFSEPAFTEAFPPFFTVTSSPGVIDNVVVPTSAPSHKFSQPAFTAAFPPGFTFPPLGKGHGDDVNNTVTDGNADVTEHDPLADPATSRNYSAASYWTRCLVDTAIVTILVFQIM